jgi:hypothetical protein
MSRLTLQRGSGLAVAVILLTACSPSTDDSAAPAATAVAVRETPRYDDGMVRFDRVPGEKGYWGNPSVT